LTLTKPSPLRKPVSYISGFQGKAVSSSEDEKKAIPKPTDFTLNRLWVEFRDRQVEQAYRNSTLDRRSLFFQRLLLFAGAIYLIHPARVLLLWSGVGLDGDASSTPPDLMPLLLHLTQAVLMFGMVAYLRASRMKIHAMSVMGLLAGLLAYVGVIALACYLPGQYWGAKFVILLLVVYVLLPIPLCWVTLMSIGASVGFWAAQWWQQGSLAGTDMFPHAADMLIANIIGQVMARHDRHRSRLDYQMQCELHDLSVRDHLTGCFNRRYLYENLLPAELSRARRQRGCVSVILCDIDHFKAINDGHHTGDVVLRQFARLLQTRVQRGGDCVVRYGGEEFLILLPGASLNAASAIAEELRLVFAEARIAAPDGRVVAATASFGVSSLDFSTNHGHVDDSTLIHDADALLYEAKHSGRNAVRAANFSAVPSV
jgi:diguanylate cyclase (GGDEF)-like protein